MGHTVYCLVPASSPPPLMYVCVVIGGVLEDLSKQPCPSDRCEPSVLNGWVPTEVPAISQLGKSGPRQWEDRHCLGVAVCRFHN